jgi:peptidoglycan/LPS O-acetylase OafA/YrhL
MVVSTINKDSDRIWFAHMLRAIAVLGVMFEHYCDVFINQNSAAAALSLAHPVTFESEQLLTRLTGWIHAFGFNTGTWGVALFFLISGFVIPISIECLGSKQFVIRRFFRVYPPYAIGLLLTVLCIAIYAAYNGILFPYTLKDYLVNATLLRDWFGTTSIDAVNWTLELEIKFYILCAFLAWVSNLRSLKTVIVTAVALLLFTVAAVSIYGFLSSNAPVLYRVIYTASNATPYLIFMFIGTGFYNFYTRYWTRRSFVRMTIFLVCLFILDTSYALDSVLIFGTLFTFLSAFGVFSICFYLRDKIAYSKPLDFIATISYPLYIIHGVNGYVLLNFLVTHNVSLYLAILITVVVMIVAAYAFHRIIELPSNKLGKVVSQKYSDTLKSRTGLSSTGIASSKVES